MREMFSEWVDEVKNRGKLPKNKEERQRSYARFEELKKGKNAREKQMQYQITHLQNKIGETTIFVSFSKS